MLGLCVLPAKHTLPFLLTHVFPANTGCTLCRYEGTLRQMSKARFGWTLTTIVAMDHQFRDNKLL